MARRTYRYTDFDVRLRIRTGEGDTTAPEDVLGQILKRAGRSYPRAQCVRVAPAATPGNSATAPAGVEAAAGPVGDAAKGE